MVSSVDTFRSDREVRLGLRTRIVGLTRGVRRLASEPLVHFLLIGFVLFAAGTAYQRQSDIHRIVVTPEHTAQLANDYALQFGVQPDPQTLDELVRRDIQDEILFRQGLALKLDRDDEIVRRRVVQKMQFLLQNVSVPPEPSEAQLRAYYDLHAERYATPSRASFTHIYFSTDAGGDDAARGRALRVLRTLSNQTPRAPGRGDPFPDLYDFSAYEPVQIERLFGRSPFAQAVATAPVGRWVGPFRSGYGWHLLYVSARQPPRRPPFASVRAAVRTDYMSDAADAANKAAFDRLARGFTVVRRDRAPSPRGGA